MGCKDTEETSVPKTGMFKIIIFKVLQMWGKKWNFPQDLIGKKILATCLFLLHAFLIQTVKLKHMYLFKDFYDYSVPIFF